MRITIFDVQHGFCAYLVANNHNCMLIDCGHNEDTGFRPSNYLPSSGCTGIERFIVSNYDEDHLSDLPNLRNIRDRVPIGVLRRNKSLSSQQLRQLKTKDGNALGPGMQALLQMLDSYTSTVDSPPPFDDVEFVTFHNAYPDFDDTNNLSLVTFFHTENFHIVLPGDLERPGWTALLRHERFRQQLFSVNLFVASHHGRESGFCKEVFDYCSPQLVIISDAQKQYATQDLDYSQFASGLLVDGTSRRVLTTRNDGAITIQASGSRGPIVTTSK